MSPLLQKSRIKCLSSTNTMTYEVKKNCVKFTLGYFSIDLDAGKDSRQKEKGTTEDKMVGWHHPLKGHEFELALGDGEGQESLACCSLWGCKESDTTERLNNMNKWKKIILEEYNS